MRSLAGVMMRDNGGLVSVGRTNWSTRHDCHDQVLELAEPLQVVIFQWMVGTLQKRSYTVDDFIVKMSVRRDVEFSGRT